MLCVITDEELLAVVQNHLRRTGKPASIFSKEVSGDPSLVLDMKRGRSVSLRMANRIARAISDETGERSI